VNALSAEWRKLRTVPDVTVLLAVTIVLTVGVSWVSAAVGGGADPAHAALLGVQVGQATAAVLGVQVMAGEFGTGLMGVTLLAIPRRGRMLAAKVAWVAALVGGAAVVAVLGSLTIGRSLLSFPLEGAVVRAVVLSILHLVLVALLGLGVGALARSAAGAVGMVLGLLYLLPVLMPMFPDPDMQRALYRLTPATAVQSLQSTVDVSGLPLSPWAALGVVALWSAAALALGAAALIRRDAASPAS
jgi:ABC-2 type transport system permease protein